MSSNQPIQITRTNYEEYFLLYTDNELSAAERAAVEAFVLLHPDLQEELDLLQDTKLDIPEISFGDISHLTAEHMDREQYNESLLLYIDNELPEADKRRLEQNLKANPELRAEHAAWLQTKLDASEKIVYPNKHELYRSEQKERPALWLRIAAAVILVAGAGNFLVQQSGRNSDDGAPNAVAGNPNKTIVITPSATDQKNTLANNTEVIAAATPEPVTEASSSREKAASSVKKGSSVTTQRGTETATTHQNTQATVEGALPADVTLSVQRTIAIDRVAANTELQTTSPNIDEAVTSVTPVAYTTKETIAAVPGKASQKQGSVRGALRKATRFIERRTGINPVDEDGRLLIGAASISLN